MRAMRRSGFEYPNAALLAFPESKAYFALKTWKASILAIRLPAHKSNVIKKGYIKVMFRGPS